MIDIVERLRRTLSDLPGNDDDLFNEIHAQRVEAADEIDRLRAGGCSRNQRTTQFCAEAFFLREENARLSAIIQGDTRMLAAYHQWCKMNGCAPSSSDISVALAALAEQGEKL